MAKKRDPKKKSRFSKKLLAELRKEGDALLDRMQTPEARAALDAAFHASAEELAEAAIEAARKEKKKKGRH